MKYIVIEGADGVGKTTIAKKLAERLNWQYVSHPVGKMKEVREQILEQDTIAVFHYYMLSNVLSILEDPDKNKVIDRFIPTTCVSASYFDPTNKEYYLEMGRKIKKRLPEPELVVILTASKECVLKRMKRELSELDVKIFENYETFADMIRKYACELYGDKVVIIDTENKNIDEVLDEVLSEVGQYVCRSGAEDS